MPEQDTIDTLQPLLESLLCATGEPLTVDRAVDAIGGVARGDITAALRALAEQYEKDGRGFRLAEVAGGFQLRTAPENIECVRRLFRERPMRLTRAMLETLAIVAYRQPATRPEIEAIRGVDVDSAVGTLLERKLIRIAGRKDAPGRPLLYATSKEFLEVFGLRELTDLPTLKEVGDLPVLASPEIDLRNAQTTDAATVDGESTAGTPVDDAIASGDTTVALDDTARMASGVASEVTGEDEARPPDGMGGQD